MRFRHLKEQIPSWMEITGTVKTQWLSALLQLAKGISSRLHFKLVDGVHPVTRHWRHFTNMAKAEIARKTVKEAIGQTMFTSFKIKVSKSVSKCKFVLDSI